MAWTATSDDRASASAPGRLSVPGAPGGPVRKAPPGQEREPRRLSGARNPGDARGRDAGAPGGVSGALHPLLQDRQVERRRRRVRATGLRLRASAPLPVRGLPGSRRPATDLEPLTRLLRAL